MEMAKKMVKGERGSGEYSYEGVTKLAAFTPSKGYGEYKGMGWSFAVVQGTNEIYAPVWQLRNIILVHRADVIAVIAVLAILVARSIAPMVRGLPLPRRWRRAT